jgi:hypothetical protein
MLAYTLNKMLESQLAVIERDMGATLDEHGGEQAADWQPLGAPVPCSFYWRKESGRGPAKQIAAPQREVAVSEGGIIFGPGTDITVNDRVGQILNPDGSLQVEGPFVVQAVFDYGDHVEIGWLSP